MAYGLKACSCHPLKITACFVIFLNTTQYTKETTEQGQIVRIMSCKPSINNLVNLLHISFKLDRVYTVHICQYWKHHVTICFIRI